MSHQVTALAATGQLGMAAAGQIRLAVVRWSGCGYCSDSPLLLGAGMRISAMAGAAAVAAALLAAGAVTLGLCHPQPASPARLGLLRHRRHLIRLLPRRSKSKSST